jgi:hypothetical protein
MEQNSIEEINHEILKLTAYYKSFEEELETLPRYKNELRKEGERYQWYFDRVDTIASAKKEIARLRALDG